MSRKPVLLAELSRDPKSYTLSLVGACECTKDIIKWLDASVVSAYLIGMKPLRIVVCADTPFGYETMNRMAAVRRLVRRTKLVAIATPGMWGLYERTFAEGPKSRCTQMFAGVDEVFLLSEGEFAKVTPEKHRALARSCDLVVEAYSRDVYRWLRDLRLALAKNHVPWYPISGPALRMVVLGLEYIEKSGGMENLIASGGAQGARK